MDRLVREQVRPTFADLNGGIPTVLAIGFAAAWIVVLAVTMGLEPAADPDAPISATQLIVSMSFMYGLLGMFAGMAVRRRWGLLSSLFAGGVLLGAGLLCLAAGHSGMWLAAQVVGGASMAAVSVGALRGTA